MLDARGLMSSDDVLEYELAEARAEIARHHLDFATISAILDGTSHQASRFDIYHALRSIRQIVG